MVATTALYDAYDSCFISYTHADEAFVGRLFNDLFNDHGVSCWLDGKDLRPGDLIDTEIDRGVRTMDKVLVVCSKNLLSDASRWWWVDRELSRALQREKRLADRTKRRVPAIIPLDLDGYLFDPDCPYPRRDDLTERLAVRFTGWDLDDAVYEKGLGALLVGLRSQRRAADK